MIFVFRIVDPFFYKIASIAFWKPFLFIIILLKHLPLVKSEKLRYRSIFPGRMIHRVIHALKRFPHSDVVVC